MLRKIKQKLAIFSLTLCILLLCAGTALAAETPAETGAEAENKTQRSSNVIDLYFVDKVNALPFTDLEVNLPSWAEHSSNYDNAYVRDLPEQAYIYSDASTQALTAFPIDAEEECFLLEGFVKDDWHYVLYEGMAGYIPAVFLDLTGSDAEYRYFSGQDMRTITGYDGDTLELCLQDALVGMGDAFAAAEQAYGVNSLFLISLCEFESANGTSSLARNRNNLAGLGGQGNWASFSSFEDCIDYLADLLSSRYLNPESSFFHGYDTVGVCQTYCNGSQHWINCMEKYLQDNFDLIQEGK